MPEERDAKTVIGKDVEVTGSIKCSNNILIEGKINGDLTCSGTASIGENASIKGNLSVEAAVVHGQIYGNITSKDKIELKSSAKVNGDVKSKRLIVEDGVSFVGKSEVNAGSIKPSQSEDDSMQQPPKSDDTARQAQGDKQKQASGQKEETRQNIKDDPKNRSSVFFNRK